MKKEIEVQAADTLLERGVRVRVGRGSITVRQPTIGTLLAISREYLQMESPPNDNLDNCLEALAGGSIEEAHRLFAAHGKRAAKIAAIGWLHSRWKIKIFADIAARYLLWRMTPQHLLQTMLLLVSLSGVQDFTSTIRLIRTMTMTSPKNLSQETKGSQAGT